MQTQIVLPLMFVTLYYIMDVINKAFRIIVWYIYARRLLLCMARNVKENTTYKNKSSLVTNFLNFNHNLIYAPNSKSCHF